jgi:hypothetical protein
MQSTSSSPPPPGVGNGFSVVLVERALREAQALGLSEDWARLPLGNPSHRATAYLPQHRVAAVLAGLAAGLRGVAPANTWLRPNAAVQAWLGGRFPDQGTIHRWLGQVTPQQAALVRDHLHRAVGEHGRFWEVLHSGRLLVVDVDGQGLAARGLRHQRAAKGYLGEGLDTGYQRYVAYAADTREVLDEFLAPGNKTLMSQLPQLLAGVAAVIPKAYRDRVLIRGDAHLGTIGNLRDLRGQGYHYVCPLQSWAASKRLREKVRGLRGGWFEDADSAGQVRRVQFWVVKRWKLQGKGRGRQLYTRATVYRDKSRDGKHEWTVLVTDLKREKGPRLWRLYHGRGGAIEEYNDQSERAYHLEVMRTGNFDGLNALHGLIGLCWDLTVWAEEGLRLPPVQAPAAPQERWLPAGRLDLAEVQRRAAHSGLRLYREGPGAALEVEDTASTPESIAWLRWLEQPIQLRLRLTG